MPSERLSMRKVREVLRLRHACGASVRTIARSVGVGHTTVAEYLRRTSVIGITWPVPAEVDDAELERRLFAPAGFNAPSSRPAPDWNHVHAELRRRGVTLLLLWEEYRAEHRDGYGYSRFCGLYIEWRRGVSATMRQTHVAGEKLFVDTPATPCRCSTGRPARNGGRTCSSPCSGPRTTPTRRRAGARAWLGRRARQRARLHRRRAEAAGLRQPARRGDGGLPLRARHQPHLPGHGRPLRRGRAADTGSASPRQGQGGGRGADRRTLHRGAPAQPALPVAGRPERGDPGGARRPERQADAQARGKPARVLRDDRPSGAAAAAGGTLRLRRMAALPGGARLPRRAARALLLGAVAADPRGGRGARQRQWRHHSRWRMRHRSRRSIPSKSRDFA